MTHSRRMDSLHTTTRYTPMEDRLTPQLRHTFDNSPRDYTQNKELINTLRAVDILTTNCVLRMHYQQKDLPLTLTIYHHQMHSREYISLTSFELTHLIHTVSKYVPYTFPTVKLTRHFQQRHLRLTTRYAYKTVTKDALQITPPPDI